MNTPQHTTRAAPGSPSTSEPASPSRRGAGAGLPVFLKARAPQHDPAEREADQASKAVLSGQRPGPITRLPQATGAPAVPAPVRDAVSGPGRAMPAPTRDMVAEHLGPQAAAARVHDGPKARAAARDLNARAFTVGSDIALGEGESADDLGLMAHEATHVVQQGSDVRRWAVQRTAGTSTNGTTPPPSDDPGTLSGEDIIFEYVRIPGFKANTNEYKHLYEVVSKAHKLGRPRGSVTRPPAQDAVWKGALKSSVKQRLGEKCGIVDETARSTFKVNMEGGSDRYYVGTLGEVAEKFTNPEWHNDAGQTRAKGPFQYQVDHRVEVQLMLPGGPIEPNALDLGNEETTNLELLERNINLNSGRAILNEIWRKLREYRSVPGRQAPKSKKLKENYNLIFEGVKAGGGPDGLKDTDHWTATQISNGDHLSPVTKESDTEMAKDGRITLFGRAVGGEPRRLRPNGHIADSEANWLTPLIIESMDLTEPFKSGTEAVPRGEEVGTLTFKAEGQGNHGLTEPLPSGGAVKILSMGTARVGYLQSMMNSRFASQLRAKFFSPIDMQELYADGDGLHGEAVIRSDIAMLERAEIGITFTPRGPQVFAEIGSGDLNFPGPFEVYDASLRIAYPGTSGNIEASGNIDFGIDRVGEGSLTATVNPATGFSAAGRFSFDTNLFSRAEVEAKYENNAYALSGTLGIDQGKIRGIKSAELTVGYDQATGTFTADGTAQLSLPGVDSARLRVDYSEAEGLKLLGDFNLSDEIPGLKDGRVAVNVARDPAGGWKVGGTIEANAKIPGLDNAQISGTFDDGLFDVNASLAMRRGIAAGTVSLGVTNMPVDDDGALIPGGEPTEELSVYGDGSVTLTLIPDRLVSTAGVRLKRDGGVVVHGRVEVPSEITLIPDEATPDYDKDLLDISIPIPLISVGVVGIEAFVRGKLTAKAGIGAGVLRNIALDVVYDFDDEDAASANGHAQLYMPVYAGIEASLTAGLQLRLLVLTAGAGLTLSGELGVRGAAQLDLDMGWSKREGFNLHALAQVYAEPVLKVGVGVNLFAEVLGFSVWDENFTLADMEFGSALRCGVKLPMDWTQNGGLDMSWDRLEFQAPSVEDVERAAKQFLADLPKREPLKSLIDEESD